MGESADEAGHRHRRRRPGGRHPLSGHRAGTRPEAGPRRRGPDQIGRNHPADVAVAGDAALSLDALAALLAGPPRASRAEEARTMRSDAERQLAAIRPVGDGAGAAAGIPEDGILVCDTTSVAYMCHMGYPVYAPRTFSTSYMGTLGFGYPAALGVKVARPDAPVVTVTGDGGFLFASNELATAVQHGIRDRDRLRRRRLGNSNRDQRGRFGGEYGTVLHNPDWVALARRWRRRRQVDDIAKLPAVLAQRGRDRPPSSPCPCSVFRRRSERPSSHPPRPRVPKELMTAHKVDHALHRRFADGVPAGDVDPHRRGEHPPGQRTGSMPTSTPRPRRVQAAVPLAAPTKSTVRSRPPAAYPMARLAPGRAPQRLLRLGALIRGRAAEIARCSPWNAARHFGAATHVGAGPDYVEYYAGLADKDPRPGRPDLPRARVRLHGSGALWRHRGDLHVERLAFSSVARKRAGAALAATATPWSCLAPWSWRRSRPWCLRHSSPQEAGIPRRCGERGPRRRLRRGRRWSPARGVDKISFTGGAAAARRDPRVGGPEHHPGRSSNASGGKSGNIVFPDADLDA
ncbi:thiamine pyrophosphate-dependent enzyme [Yinghuangia aomiensis]